jgi:hypothetical protein
VPLLEHQLRKARASGIRRIVFATSYRASMFTEAFGDGSRLGLELVYVTEDEPLGTAGAIRNASRKLTCDADSPVVVLNGDILSGHDLVAQIAMHEKSGAAVTMHLTLVNDARRYGAVPTTSEGKVIEFVEKSPNPPTNQVNAGCYVFRRSAIDAIPEGRVVSVEYETFPGLLASGATIMGYVEGAYWLDVGTPGPRADGVAGGHARRRCALPERLGGRSGGRGLRWYCRRRGGRGRVGRYRGVERAVRRCRGRAGRAGLPVGDRQRSPHLRGRRTGRDRDRRRRDGRRRQRTARRPTAVAGHSASADRGPVLLRRLRLRGACSPVNGGLRGRWTWA